MKTLTALLLMVLSVDFYVAADPIPEVWKRDLVQFSEMIDCKKLSAWDYIHYGCFCGSGGKGTPVDDLDRCCKVHDDCYGDVERKCPGFDVYSAPYKHTCDEGKLTCAKSKNECETLLCECDQKAAECFAKSEWNKEHNWMDQQRCT